MSTKVIAFLLGLLSVGALTAGLYYGTDLLEGGQESAGQQPPARQDVPARQETRDDVAAVAPDGDEQDEEDAEGAEGAEDVAVIPPSFDIVRVEPSGEIVTAGRSAPAAEVEMLLRDERIATDTANNDGEWAMVPEKPLPVGAHELVLRASGSNGRGGPVEGDRATVIIEGQSEVPLVALAPRGEPVELVQRPQETVSADAGDAQPRPQPDFGDGADSAPEEPTDMASEDNDTEAETQPRAGAAVIAGLETEREDGGGAAGQSEAPADGAQRLASAEPQRQSDALTPVVPEQRDAAAEASRPSSAEQPPESEAEAPSSEDVEVAARADSPQPATEPDEAEIAVPRDPQRIAIDAVEVEEPADIHVSGSAEPDSPVRLYVNNEHLGDVRSDAQGRWAATVNRAVPPGRYAVRADAVDVDGDVEARSEVRFDRVRVALAGEEQAPAEANADRPNSSTPAGPDTAAPTRQERSGSESAAESDIGGREIAAAPTPDADREVPQGSAGGEVGSLEIDADPNAVYIERGDNLWRIARSLYGQGIRYTVIYEANRGQIRDPDLIYPGQVFTIPLPDGE